ncbi:DinB family protein [Psychrobacillus sp. FJAT-51614]|uniref:DinB family protein n=1 Tax=Psychrobacillus mangrovi TaxID=3117745 RepID=A0ABU8EZB8_9BACI
MFIEKINKIRADLFHQLDQINDEQFNQKPEPNKWSPKEIIDHLVKLEKVVSKGINYELKNTESPKANRKPIQLTTIRVIKAKAPTYIIPSEEYQTKEEMKDALHQSRMVLLTIYETTDKQVLKNKSLKHPIFGQLPLIQWLSFVGYHEKRHLKQLEKTIEIIKGHKK